MVLTADLREPNAETAKYAAKAANAAVKFRVDSQQFTVQGQGNFVSEMSS
jgi:hypothetical protein